MALDLGNLDDFNRPQSLEEQEAWAEFYTPEKMREHDTTARQLEQLAVMPQFRTLLNKGTQDMATLVQYRCRHKGCVLAALVLVHGSRYWLRQAYVGQWLMSARDYDDGLVPLSVPEYVRTPVVDLSGGERPSELQRQPNTWAAAPIKPDGEPGMGDWWQASCAHSSLDLTGTTLQEEVKKARRAKNQTLRP